MEAVKDKITGAVGTGFDAAQTVLDNIVSPPAIGLPQCALRDSAPLKVFALAATAGVVVSAFSSSWRKVITSLIYFAFFTLLVGWLARGCHTKWAWGIAILAALRPISMLIDHFAVKK